jgi:hypothetical protein
MRTAGIQEAFLLRFACIPWSFPQIISAACRRSMTQPSMTLYMNLKVKERNT